MAQDRTITVRINATVLKKIKQCLRIRDSVNELKYPTVSRFVNVATVRLLREEEGQKKARLVAGVFSRNRVQRRVSI